MEVFYVLVLVLVARAVPSHGRTESEGTVFDKTQPHESMNNVTVSGSKLVPFHRSWFVMQWQRSFCRSRACLQQTPTNFTVHGLWPHNINCTSNGIYGRFELFNFSQLGQHRVGLLSQYWPDLVPPKKNWQFWADEFNKHGSCTFVNQDQYFDLTLAMVRMYGDIFQLSKNRGGPVIAYGHSYMPGLIRAAVIKVTNAKPQLICQNAGKIIQLKEIRICFVNLGGNSVGQPTDCPGYDYWNCGKGNVKVYIP